MYMSHLFERSERVILDVGVNPWLIIVTLSTRFLRCFSGSFALAGLAIRFLV